MSSPQLEDGHTKIANSLLEAILRHGFTETQLCVVFAVIRRTYGFNKKEDELSLSQIAKMTIYPVSRLSPVVNALVGAKVLRKKEGRFANSLSLNKNYEQWGVTKNGSSGKRKGGVTDSVTEGLRISEPQKTTPKDITKRDCAFAEFWQAYPRKKSKGTAERWWRTHRPNEQLQEAIMAGLERAKTSNDWTKESGKYIPYPTSWLNAKGWEDEYAPPEPKVHAR